jgi:glycosyltransferase involved in cell wall biosynthesis
VIPARNAEPFIAAAIQSVLDQSLPASRIIVVNDRSTDDTAGAAGAFGDRVRIVDGHGVTAGAARNLGVCHSDGELVAFLDADDVCHLGRLAAQAHALRERPDAGLVFCDGEYADAAGRPSGAVFSCPEFDRDAFLGQLFERNRILSASVSMVRRSAFDAVGGFDERLTHAEDYDLWIRLAASFPIEYVARTLVTYRVHASNLSNDREALRGCEVEILGKHAIQDIRAALRHAHDSPARADLALSRVLFRMERYAEGEVLLDGIDPGVSHRALRHFMVGNFAVKRDERASAAAAFSRCLQDDAAFAPAHNNLGVLAALERRYEESRAHFLEAVGLRPDYSDPRHNIEGLTQGCLSELRYTFAPLRSVLRPGERAAR